MTDRQFVLSIYPKAFVYKCRADMIAIFDRNQPSKFGGKIGHEPLSNVWRPTNKDAWKLAADEIRYAMLEKLES